jgi:hypothetical protein
MYDPFIFNESILDRSLVGRSLRYKISGKILEDRRRNIEKDPETLTILKRILARFASDCHEEGSVPVVLLFPKAESGANFKNQLQDVIESSHIIAISASDVFDVSDKMNYDETGHYIDKRNRQLAEFLGRRIWENINKKP